MAGDGGPEMPPADDELASGAAERARRGVSRWISAAGRRTDAAARAMTPYGLLAFLAASALAPVVGAGLTTSAEVAAALGQLGGLGSSYLAEVLIGTAERLRRGGGEPDSDPDGEQWRDTLAEALEPLLAGSGEQARALRAEVGTILRDVGAVRVALTASAQATDELREELGRCLHLLGSGTEELRWMITESRQFLDELMDELVAQRGEQRQQTDLVLQLLVAITQLRPQLAGEPAPPVVVAGDEGPPGDDVSSAELPCPYPGLASFQSRDAPWFFGRERLTAQVVGRLAEQLTGARPLALVGVSGVGKSSLLRAGVLPALAAGALDTGDRSAAIGATDEPAGAPRSWPWMLIIPGTDPLTELVSRTACLAREPAMTALQAVRRRPEDFGALATQAALTSGGPTGRLVIVVDQFEEIFTRCEDPAEQAAFVTALTHAGRAVVVLAIRADFYADCTRLPGMAQVLADGHLVVGPMGADDLRRAVVEPARRAGLSVEDGLVELLLADLGVNGAGYDPGSLPLLAHVLHEVWQQRQDGRLTLAWYRQTGGLRNAIANSAERIYRELDDDERARLRAGLLRLVAVTDGRAVVRRRSERQALDPGLLQRLVAARLVTTGDDGIEISHEALLTCWPRLSDWLAESRTELVIRQRLEAAARTWTEEGEDADLLYRGTQLTAAREWASGRDDLGERERRFLAAGAAVAAIVEAARARTTRRLRRQVAGLAVVLVLALVATTIAAFQTNAMRLREAQTRSRQHAAEARAASFDGRKAKTLALQAWQDSHTMESRGALLSAQMLGQVAHLGTGTGSTAVAISADGARIAVGHGDGSIQRWDPATLLRAGPPLETGIVSLVNTMAYSGDGRRLATGTLPRNPSEHSKATTVWDAATGRRLRDLPGAGFVAWRPGTGHLLSVFYDIHPETATYTLAVGEWDPADGRRLLSIPLPTRRFPSPSVNSLAVSPDGKLVAVSWTDGITRVWRLPDGAPLTTIRPIRPIRPSKSATTSGELSAANAVFASDGNLVTSEWGGEVRVWEMPSGRHVRDLPSNDLPPNRRLVASPGGYVYSPGSDGVLEMWYEPSGRALRGSPPGFNRPIRDLAVSADGQSLVTTGPTDATTFFRRGTGWLRQPTVAVLAARFDPTGRTIASGGGDGTLRLWASDGSTTGLPAPAHRYPDTVYGLAYAPDGTLAVTVNDGTVHLRDPDGKDRTIIHLAGNEAPGDVQFSPDGSLLAVTVRTVQSLSATPDHGSVIVWDVGQQRERRRLDTGTQEPIALTFSSDGKRLVAATYEAPLNEDFTAHRQSVIRGWRTDDLSVLGSYSVGQNLVVSLAASPDDTLAVAGTSGRVELRRMGDGSLLRTLDHTHAVRRVVYSPDGRLLVTATGSDDLIRLWDARTGALLAQLTGHEGFINSLDFSPDGKVLAGADATGDVGLWHVDPVDAVSGICRSLSLGAEASGSHLPELCKKT